jgi:hypothetical protein
MLLSTFQQFLTSRHPVSTNAILFVCTAGLAVGLLLGYIIMGSIHAVIFRLSIFCRDYFKLVYVIQLGVFAKELPLSCDNSGNESCLQFLEMGIERHYQDGHPIVAGASPLRRDLPMDATSQTHNGFASQANKIDSAVAARLPSMGKTIHTLCTSNGSPYVNFQTRIMYGTYKLTQQMPGGELLAGFTRILHRTQPDELMQVRCCLLHSKFVASPLVLLQIPTLYRYLAGEMYG